MKKICIATLILACFLLSATLISAHPGRTDEDGGHYVAGTSEYHYHHGYPAHDHYDMDGDGDKDCPYNFDDKTGWNSGNSTTNKTPATVRNSTPTSPLTKDPTPNATLPVWPFVLSGIFFVAAVGLGLFSDSSQKALKAMRNEKDSEIAALKKTYRESLDREARSNAETLSKTKAFYMALITQKKASESELAQARRDVASAGKKLAEIQAQIHRGKQEIYRLRIVRRRLEEAPPDVLLPEDGLPVWWKKDSEKPYGDYTVYVSRDTKIFHTDKLCAGYGASRIHVFQAISYSRPCKRCAENFFDFAEVPDWYAPKDIDPPETDQ